MKIVTDKKKVDEILTRGVEDVIVKEDLQKALSAGRQLRVKFGIDPTSSDLHIGHSVVLRKLRQFQELGHKIVLIIGDFTALIGDPSGKDKTRPHLAPIEVKKNMKDYLKQAGKIIDIQKTETRHNSQWLSKLYGPKLFELLGMVSFNQIIERDDFSKRLKEHKSIRMHELLYPIMQGYDSVVIKADIECGGTDQLFNLLVGRSLMEKKGMRAQNIVTTPLLEGTDGVRKMSKSLGNYIGLTDKPNNMFGKVMSVDDGLVKKYFLLCTDKTEKEITTILKQDPRDAKLELAQSIVALYHGVRKAEEARDGFIETFSKKKKPTNLPVKMVKKSSMNIVDLLVETKLAGSKSEARRLIEQGGVRINEKKEKDPKKEVTLHQAINLQVGKHTFLKVKGE